MKPAFRVYSTPTADSVQVETGRVFDLASEFYTAKRIRLELDGATELKRAHSLGRVPFDVLLGPPTASAKVWVRAFDDRYVYVEADAPCSISLWVL